MELKLLVKTETKKIEMTFTLPMTDKEFIHKIETGEYDHFLLNGYGYGLTLENGKPVATRRPEFDETDLRSDPGS